MDLYNLPAPVRALLVSLVAEAVRPVVAAALVDALPELLRRAALPVLLTKKDLCSLTGWSTRKVDYLVAEGRIPVIRRGRSVLFRTADVEAFLGEGLVPAKRSGNAPCAGGNA